MCVCARACVCSGAYVFEFVGVWILAFDLCRIVVAALYVRLHRDLFGTQPPLRTYGAAVGLSHEPAGLPSTRPNREAKRPYLARRDETETPVHDTDVDLHAVSQREKAKSIETDKVSGQNAGAIAPTLEVFRSPAASLWDDEDGAAVSGLSGLAGMSSSELEVESDDGKRRLLGCLSELLETEPRLAKANDALEVFKLRFDKLAGKQQQLYDEQAAAKAEWTTRLTQLKTHNEKLQTEKDELDRELAKLRDAKGLAQDVDQKMRALGLGVGVGAAQGDSKDAAVTDTQVAINAFGVSMLTVSRSPNSMRQGAPFACLPLMSVFCHVVITPSSKSLLLPWSAKRPARPS